MRVSEGRFDHLDQRQANFSVLKFSCDRETYDMYLSELRGRRVPINQWGWIYMILVAPPGFTPSLRK